MRQRNVFARPGESVCRAMPGRLPELEGLTGQELQTALAAMPQSVRYHWQWKIKQMLDPNGAADSATYTTLEHTADSV